MKACVISKAWETETPPAAGPHLHLQNLQTVISAPSSSQFVDFCLSTCFQELIIHHGLVSWPWIQHADLMISEPLFTYAPCLRQARPVNVPHKSQDFPQTKDFSRFPEQKLASSEKVTVHQPSATPWTSCRFLELWGFSAVPWCLTVPADAFMPAHFWNDDSASLWRRRRSVVLKPSQQLDGSREACDDSVSLKWKIHRRNFFACEAILGLHEFLLK